jgi:hypothetical protein
MGQTKVQGSEGIRNGRVDAIRRAVADVTGILREIREAYDAVGITLDRPAAYGTYYRLLCSGCGRMVGNVGDKLLAGMAAELVAEQFDLYATGLLGCACGHQRERAREAEPRRWLAAQSRAWGPGESAP